MYILIDLHMQQSSGDTAFNYWKSSKLLAKLTGIYVNDLLIWATTILKAILNQHFQCFRESLG